MPGKVPIPQYLLCSALDEERFAEKGKGTYYLSARNWTLNWALKTGLNETKARTAPYTEHEFGHASRTKCPATAVPQTSKGREGHYEGKKTPQGYSIKGNGSKERQKSCNEIPSVGRCALCCVKI